MSSYLAGNIVTVSAAFTDEDTATAVDPTSVVLSVSVNGAPAVRSTYMGGATTGPYTIVRGATGAYHAEVDTTGMLGLVQYQWAGTGAAQVVALTSFNVAGPAL